ncbi:unnamed protein product [Soboliphyme baturini]|uniref:Prolactin n=1 Tax=Soboliphyme baturini TaxID=241478 RepID=A0A183IR70_9BILA|nr:unnamed protein product [Soboliphyme baturini]
MFYHRVLVTMLLVSACLCLPRSLSSKPQREDDGDETFLSVLRNFVRSSVGQQKEFLGSLLDTVSEPCRNCRTAGRVVTDAPLPKRTDNTGLIGGTLLHAANILNNMMKMELVNRKLEQLKATGDIYQFIHGINP